MKKLKKILSVVLTLAMVLGMSVTTWAAEGDSTESKVAKGTKEDKSTITISGFDLEKKGEGENATYELPTGLQISAYRIVKAVYANNESALGKDDGSFSNYQVVYGTNEVGEGNVINLEPTNGAISITESQLTAVWNYITTYNGREENTEKIKADGTITVGDNNTTKDESNKTFSVSIGDLPVGSYLIAVTGSESQVYNPIVASIYYEVNKDQTGNIFEGGSYNLKSTANWVKVTNTPGVEKSIVKATTDTDGTATSTKDKHSSANIGDTINYEVVINPIPSYGGDYPVLNVKDTLSKGLQYKENSLVVAIADGVNTVTLNKDKDYTLKVTNPAGNKKTTELEVDFVLANTGYTLNSYVGKKVVITYSAILTDSADINQNANENNVILNYTRDSRTDNEGNNPSVDNKTFTYTFDIDGSVTGSVTTGIITKYGEEINKETGKNRPLIGAEFTLYTDEDCTIPYTNKSVVGKDKDKNDITFNGTVTSIEGGQLPIKGLATGTYYLKETKAPEGYSLNTHVFKIEISAKYYGDTDVEGGQIPDGMKKGQLASWSIKIDNEDIATFTVNNGNVDNFDEKAGVGIQNTKISSLPSTGGIGTTIFTIGGCAIMILAAGLYFASRRKSAK